MLQTSPKFAKFATAIAVAEAGNEIGKKVKSWVDGKLTWQVSVSETETVFRAVHAWLMENVPESQHRFLTVGLRATGGRSYDTVSEVPGEGDSKRERLIFAIDDEATHNVEIDGHLIKVWVHDPLRGGTGKKDEEPLRLEPVSIRFRARTQAGQRAVMALLDRLYADQTASKPALRMVTHWGSWTYRMDVPQRTLDSVILPPEQMARIVGDFERFLAMESRYTTLGTPWHRGYMFHGPPGTGKTSLIKGLATHFGLDLWYIPLSDLKDETGLMGLISEVRPRSMLLLEDIDTIRISHDREQDGPGITMSSLLNALDGVATPHGLISCMTTNHFSSLDEALTRPGRMDVIEEIKLPGPNEVRAMFQHFYGKSPKDILCEKSQAEIAEVFKRHMDDFDGAVKELSYQNHFARVVI
jgi:hypothetical protein